MSTLIGMPLLGRALRNLFSPPATRRYPVETRKPIAGSRGHVAVDLTSCEFCGNCAKRCAPGAITLDRENRTLTLERLRCIGCGVCTEVCSSKSLVMAGAPLGAFGSEEVAPDGSSPRGVLTARQAAPPAGPENVD